MGDVIQCPTCSKKFRLPDRPPAVFTCTACGTPMDLSAFRAAAPSPAPSAPAGASGPAAGPVSHARPGPHGHGHHGRPRGGRAAHAAAARAMRARRGHEAPDEGEGEEEAPRFARPKKDNNAVIIASLVGLVVVLGVVFLMMSNKPRETVPPLEPVAAGSSSARPAEAPAAMAVEAPPVEEAPSGPPKPGPIPYNKTQVHEVDHHPEATAEEKDKIDKLIDVAVFQNAGSDSRDAGTELVKIGMKAVPRLIDAFHKVKTGRTFDDRLGRMEAGIVDGILRRIDGYMERVRKKQPQIKAHSTSGYAETTARMWVAWWDAGGWKAPQKPWDPVVDGPLEDESAGGAGD